MVKVKCGAIIEEVPKGSLKWYKLAGWTVIPDQDKKTAKKAQKEPKTEDLEEVKTEDLEEIKDETNTEANVTS
jgi:hypothetical protein